MAARIAANRSVPVSSWGTSARPAERLGGPEPRGSQGRQEGHKNNGGENDAHGEEEVNVIEDELTLGRQAGDQRPSKPEGNGQTDDESRGSDQRRFDQHACQDLQPE